MLNVRRAKAHESEVLSDVAIKSEAYWGYDSDYVEKFKSVYRVTEEFISNNQVFVMEEDNTVVGFYGVLIGDKETSLEYFFIEPSCIGKGYGRSLWDHMIDNCECLGIRELVMVTSPQAEGFYVKMGSVPAGEVESLLRTGRMIPRLTYAVGNQTRRAGRLGPDSGL